MNIQNEIVVGIDIGTTSAICILDKNLNVLFLKSKKEYKISEMIDDIIKFGKPLLISCDVAKVPKKIIKISKSLGVKVFHPKENVRESKKQKLTSNYSYNNWHERDAIFSAIVAMKFLRKKLLNKKVETKNLIEKNDSNKDKDNKELIKNYKSYNSIDVKRLVEKIKILKEENKKLKDLIEELKNKRIIERKIIEFREVRDRKLEIENEALKTVIEILKLKLEDNEIPYLKIEEINEDFLKIIKQYINNFAIVSNQIEKFYIIENLGVEFVITDKNIENIWNFKLIFDDTSKYEKIGKIKLEYLKNKWKEKLLSILKY